MVDLIIYIIYIDDFPINTSIYKGFSMAMLNNQRVYGMYQWQPWQRLYRFLVVKTGDRIIALGGKEMRGMRIWRV